MNVNFSAVSPYGVRKPQQVQKHVAQQSNQVHFGNDEPDQPELMTSQEIMAKLKTSAKEVDYWMAAADKKAAELNQPTDLNHFAAAVYSQASLLKKFPSALHKPDPNSKGRDVLIQASANALLPQSLRSQSLTKPADMADILITSSSQVMQQLRDHNFESREDGELVFTPELRLLFTKFFEANPEGADTRKFFEFLRDTVSKDRSLPAHHQKIGNIMSLTVEAGKNFKPTVTVSKARKQGNNTKDFQNRLEELKAAGEIPADVAENVQAIISKGLGGGILGGDTVKNRLNYFLFDYPWTRTEVNMNTTDVRDVLEEEHSGMGEVKDRIVEFMAVENHLRSVGRRGSGNVLILVGPPGVGKSTIAKSIAKATGRKFSEMPVGGVNDPNKISGHKSTYVGSSPGGIHKAMTTAGSKNPLILVDEVDKMGGGGGAGRGGNPVDVLLKAFETSTNDNFEDNYLESDLPMDLSEVLWVLTANYKEQIPEAILSRGEVIDLAGYLTEQKMDIANKHLLRRTADQFALDTDQLQFTDDALKLVIERYAPEAGVRRLDQKIRKFASQIILRLQAGDELPEVIDVDFVEKILKRPDLKTRGESREDFEERVAMLNNDGLFSEVQYKGLQKLVSKMGRSGVDGRDPDADKLKERLNVALFDMPWTATETEQDINVAAAKLEETHYGMDEAKKKIIQFLRADNRMRAAGKGGKRKVLFLNGPAGTGKTTLGESVANATGRRFAKVALGGMKDEKALRGHSSTYIGAIKGRIAEALVEAGSTNPVIVLDEIEKADSEAVYAALLEILDPNQNHAFVDQYIGPEVPIDLSNVLFITTGNGYGNITEPVYNRIEEVSVEPYDQEEKVGIAQNYILPRIRDNYVLDDEQLRFTDDAIELIVKQHAFMEGGVRILEQVLTSVADEIVDRLESDSSYQPPVVTAELVGELAGPPKAIKEEFLTEPMVGRTNGLAVTGGGSGGAVFPLLASLIKTNTESETHPGVIKLADGFPSGKMEQDSQESAKWAFHVARKLAKEEFGVSTQGKVLEVAVAPERGTPGMGGDSAGAAFTTTVLSALTDRKVRSDVAMTGTITIQGHVKAIGGEKQKIRGALDKDMKVVFIPTEVMPMLDKFPTRLMDRIKPMTMTEFKANVARNGGEYKPEDPSDTRMAVVGAFEVRDIIDYALMPAEGQAQLVTPPVSDQPIQFGHRLNLVS